MALNEFRQSGYIIWDMANKTITDNPQANGGDANGRTLKVLVKNAGAFVDLTGFNLNLGWKTSDGVHFGLDAFTAIDATQGLFEIYYTSGMLSNSGMLGAALQLVDAEGIIESVAFKITVSPSIIDPSAAQTENTFTALATALVTVNGWNARIDAVEADFIARANNLDATYPTRLLSAEQQLAQKASLTQLNAVASGAPKAVYATLSALQTAKPTGDTNIYLVTGDVKEVATLTVTGIPTVAGNITVTLNGVVKTIAVDPLVQTTVDLLATLIRSQTFTGWTTSGTGADITFTATTGGTRTDGTFGAGTTGVTATIATTTQGTAVDGKWYYWSGSAWTAGGIYQPTNISINEVSQEKLDFPVTPVEETINKFDKDNVLVDTSINSDTGNYYTAQNIKATKNFEKIKPNTQYVFSNINGIAFYDSNKNFISFTNISPFTTPANCYFLKAYSWLSLSTARINEGSVLQAWTPYGNKLDGKYIKDKTIAGQHITDKTITREKIQFTHEYATITNSWKISVDTVNKEITIPKNAVLSNLKRGIQLTVEKVFDLTTLLSTGGQNHLFYNLDTGLIEGYKSNQNVENPNSWFLGILYGGKIYNTIDKEIWVIDGISNGGWDIKSETVTPKITLPSKIYVKKGDTFSVYYKNVIKNSLAFDKGLYFVKPMLKNGESYSHLSSDFLALQYKLDYTSNSNNGASVFVEFRIINPYTNATIDSKVVEFITTDFSVAKNITMVTLGDSFTDTGITKELFNISNATNLSIDFVGLNSGGVVGRDDIRDDAYAGKGYRWYTTESTYSIQPLRSDRPLKDAVWDVGWGENETNGWTTGQTYADLTATQKSHGVTKNPFYNSGLTGSNKFDFGYYVDNFLNDGRYGDVVFKPSAFEGTIEGKIIKHIDCVTSFAGLNDVIWMDNFYDVSSSGYTLTLVKQMINNIFAWDPNIKILLSTVTPQRENDESLQRLTYFQSNFKHYEKSKYWQEIWNEMLIDMVASSYSDNVMVIPTSAHFDTRFSFYTSTISPNKFDNSYTEVISADVHPNDTGYKYIADCSKNIIYGVNS